MSFNDNKCGLNLPNPLYMYFMIPKILYMQFAESTCCKWQQLMGEGTVSKFKKLHRN